jgi:hypothetical protein
VRVDGVGMRHNLLPVIPHVGAFQKGVSGSPPAPHLAGECPPGLQRTLPSGRGVYGNSGAQQSCLCVRGKHTFVHMHKSPAATAAVAHDLQGTVHVDSTASFILHMAAVRHCAVTHCRLHYRLGQRTPTWHWQLPRLPLLRTTTTVQ